MSDQSKKIFSIAFVWCCMFAWVYVWWPLGRMAHDAYFNWFLTLEVPNSFFPSSPAYLAAEILVFGHAVISPIVWFILGKVFYERKWALVSAGALAYLIQALLIFLAQGDGLWLNDPRADLFGIWGLASFLAVIALNLLAAVVAPLIMLSVASIKARSRG